MPKLIQINLVQCVETEVDGDACKASYVDLLSPLVKDRTAIFVKLRIPFLFSMFFFLNGS